MLARGLTERGRLGWVESEHARFGRAGWYCLREGVKAAGLRCVALKRTWRNSSSAAAYPARASTVIRESFRAFSNITTTRCRQKDPPGAKRPKRVLTVVSPSPTFVAETYETSRIESRISRQFSRLYVLDIRSLNLSPCSQSARELGWGRAEKRT